jgi:hypothetical protein
MKYLILPILNLIKIVFRSIYVLIFILVLCIKYIALTLWELKYYKLSRVNKDVKQFLNEMWMDEYTGIYCTPPKTLWDFILNGRNEK